MGIKGEKYLKDYIRNVVSNLIKKYKTNNVYELVDKMDIIFIRAPLDSSVNGFYQYFKRNKIIYINDKLDYFTERYVLAHELGHAVLHPKSNITYLKCNTFYSKDKIELEANTFACELLITDDLLIKYKHSTFDEMAAKECLPKELIRLKYSLIMNSQNKFTL